MTIHFQGRGATRGVHAAGPLAAAEAIDLGTGPALMMRGPSKLGGGSVAILDGAPAPVPDWAAEWQPADVSNSSRISVKRPTAGITERKLLKIAIRGPRSLLRRKSSCSGTKTQQPATRLVDPSTPRTIARKPALARAGLAGAAFLSDQRTRFHQSRRKNRRNS